MIFESKAIEPEWAIRARKQFDETVDQMVKGQRAEIERRVKNLMEASDGHTAVRGSES